MKKLAFAYGLAALSGVLMALSMPGYDVAFLAWFGLVPLLLALRNKSALHQVLLIHVTTVLWSVVTHLWYPAIFSGWGYLIMIAGGLFYGGFLKMGWDMQNRIGGWYAVFAVPVTFSVFEWAKTVIPLTRTWWIELAAKSQWTVPANLQLLSVTGFVGLSFLIMLTNAALARLAAEGFPLTRRHLPYAALLVLPVLNAWYGNLQLKTGEALLASRPITIGATVDLINQDREVAALGSEATAGDGYLADTPEMKEKIFAVNRELSRQLQAEKKVDIIVWGENEFMSLADDWLVEQLTALTKELDAAVVADTVWKTGDAMYDTALMVGADGKEVGRTPKIFTLWGEEAYGFSPGPRDYAVYRTEYGPVALAVCWDRHDPSILRGYARNGARLALIPADDDFEANARFPYFAASDAVFRAVENRLAIGSGSTSGIAQVITPFGEMTARSGVNERGYIAGDTFTFEGESFYTRYGDVFAYLLSAVFAVMLFASERSKRRNARS